MSNYLTLNGQSWPIAFESGGHTTDLIGSRGRAYSSTMRDSTRAAKRTWRGRTRILKQADAELLESLLRGEGHHFDFETGLYSCVKGLGPNTGYSGVTIDSAHEVIGTYSAAFDSGGSCTWAFGYTGDWSVMFWHYYGEQQYCAITYDADTTTTTKYVANNGNTWVPTAGATISCYSWSSGSLTLEGKQLSGSAGACWYDELVVQPVKVTTDLLAANVNSGAGREFSDLPRLLLSGDLVKTTTPIVVIGKPGQATHYATNLSGTFTGKDRAVEFELIEV